MFIPQVNYIRSFERSLTSKLLPCLQAICFFVIFCSGAKADYANRIHNANTGFLIKLDNHLNLSSTPAKGTDGSDYYQVGSSFSLGTNTAGVSVSGVVDCIGKTWGSVTEDIDPAFAYHKLFTYAPKAGFSIDGKTVYRINSNLFMIVDAQVGDRIWSKFSSAVCANALPGTTATASMFSTYLPVVLKFYIKDKIIDGRLPILSMDLAGYVRVFSKEVSGPLFTGRFNIEETTIPVRLASSQLDIDPGCVTTTSTGQSSVINFRHGLQNSTSFDNYVTEKITYTCKFALSTKVRLKIDYATDNDPEKRLPMVNSSNAKYKIYSELKMTDDSTGQTGKEFTVDIKDLKTISISSHIKGNNAVSGNYKGSAWLIATFD